MEIKYTDSSKIKLVAFDLDGTLTQHKTHLEPATRQMLEKLSEKYKLLMIGAGNCRRIFDQLDHFPIDIIGNYGLQYAEYDKALKDIVIRTEKVLPCDRKSVSERVDRLRRKYSWKPDFGDSVEFHASGAVTIPVLGTTAPIEQKLAYDPDRSKRRAIYPDVCAAFPEYTVFVGGSSSFDMVPAPYDKYFALSAYATEHGLPHDSIVYVGDDYGSGGNDEAVYVSDIAFVKVDNYRDTPALLSFLL